MSGLKRKLTIILYADVAGYSRLMGLDEEGSHRQVMAILDSAADTINKSGGEVLRYAGDAILATFSSVVGAIEASIAIQGQISAVNEGVTRDRHVQIRIGLNLGDVIEDRGEVYGDGVNVAARLESLAVPGVSAFPVRLPNRFEKRPVFGSLTKAKSRLRTSRDPSRPSISMRSALRYQMIQA
jgi:class 3 adenylate cyclase